jgi:perosamine synthetase
MPAYDLPALLGGVPAFPQGPPAWPLGDPDVLEAMQHAYRDGSWGKYRAEHSGALELFLREYHNVEHVLLCGSGTYAIELGLRALQVAPGDEVILAAYDYPGNFLAIHALGAQPVLVDLDPDNWALATAKLAEALGPRTRALLVSHLHGGLVAMSAVMAFARTHGLLVLEDAAQAPGALVEGRRAGAWGDGAILSFGGSKLLTAGRGGAFLTPHADLAQRARTHLQRGNVVCPLSELQAAVLLPQWRRLQARNRQRLENVARLRELLADLPGVRPFVNRLPDSAAAFYKLGFQYDAEQFGLPRASLVAALRAEGVALDAGFAAAHVGRSPRRYRRGGELAEAERAHHGCVVLHHPVLLGSAADSAAVAHAWHKVHAHADRLCRA